ncbi:hypothetical protein K456DRAFT_266764 [Colletotrichum gloeosporioides 23]|nr:hypothetical protein K456DRAFT_266764 [Colletotrichum gloeosporioides 23]
MEIPTLGQRLLLLMADWDATADPQSSLTLILVSPPAQPLPPSTTNLRSSRDSRPIIVGHIPCPRCNDRKKSYHFLSHQRLLDSDPGGDLLAHEVGTKIRSIRTEYCCWASPALSPPGSLRHRGAILTAKALDKYLQITHCRRGITQWLLVYLRRRHLPRALFFHATTRRETWVNEFQQPKPRLQTICTSAVNQSTCCRQSGC